jgi:hypothetical protein
VKVGANMALDKQDARMVIDKDGETISDKIGNLLKKSQHKGLAEYESYKVVAGSGYDWSPALEKAKQDLVAENGGVIIAYVGSFDFYSPFSLPDGEQIQLVGAGMKNTYFNFYGTGTAINAIGTSSARKYFYLSQLSLICKSATATWGIEMEWNTVNSGMDNVDIEQFPTGQMRIDNNWQLAFYHCLFNGANYTSGSSATSQYGVKIGYNTTTLSFYDCTFDNNKYGVYGEGGNGHSFINPITQSNEIANIFLGWSSVGNAGSIAHQIIKPYMEKGSAPATQWGIKLVGNASPYYPIATCSIIGGTLNDVPYQLYLENAPQTTVMGVNFSSSATRTLELHGASNRCVFIGNNNSQAQVLNPDNIPITAIEMDKLIFASTVGQLNPGVDMNMNLKNIYNIGKGQITNFLIINTGVSASSVDNGSLFKDSADGKLKYKDATGTVNLLY